MISTRVAAAVAARSFQNGKRCTRSDLCPGKRMFQQIAIALSLTVQSSQRQVSALSRFVNQCNRKSGSIAQAAPSSRNRLIQRFADSRLHIFGRQLAVWILLHPVEHHSHHYQQLPWSAEPAHVARKVFPTDLHSWRLVGPTAAPALLGAGAITRCQGALCDANAWHSACQPCLMLANASVAHSQQSSTTRSLLSAQAAMRCSPQGAQQTMP